MLWWMTAVRVRGSLRPVGLVVHALVLAVVLGGATLVVWLLVGREAFQGGIGHVITERGLPLYGLLATASAVIGYLAGRGPRRHGDLVTVAVVTMLAWLVEGAILVVFGQLLADELRSLVFRAAVWLTATGALLQPIAVVVGAWIGLRGALKGANRG
jgi:hypothetical protein